MISCLNDYNIRVHNTFRMDVNTRHWIEYTSASDLYEISDMIRGMKWMSIGQGSNLLFEADFDGAILYSRILDVDICNESDEWMQVRAGAGVVMDELIANLSKSNVWGLENLSGIPGTVGASAVQNVGAYGVEAGDLISLVEAFDMIERHMVRFRPEDIGYDYRYSRFKSSEWKNRYVITYVTYRFSRKATCKIDYGRLKSCLPTDCQITPQLVRDTVLSMRSTKLPDVAQVGSAGSYFKNPVLTKEEFSKVEHIAKDRSLGEVPSYISGDFFKVPAAWLIEHAGLKGVKHGEVATWHKQPLVIVNSTGSAKPKDVCRFEQLIIERVYGMFGIILKPEVEHVR